MFVNCNKWPNGNCTGFLEKTLWDVLELIIIPTTLAGIALYLEREDKKTDRLIAREREKIDREIAQDQQYERALQNYFDIMQKLVVENNLLKSNRMDTVSKFALVKTATTLQNIDIERKRLLINFLCLLGIANSEPDTPPIIALSHIDLQRVNLSNLNLKGFYFERTNFEETIISHANLAYSYLEFANLRKSKITYSNLAYARLGNANLEYANLEGSNLEGATLHMANLDMANFRLVNLKSAKLRDCSLNGTNFEGAIMPDGKIFNPNIHSIIEK